MTKADKVADALYDILDFNRPFDCDCANLDERDQCPYHIAAIALAEYRGDRMDIAIAKGDI